MRPADVTWTTVGVDLDTDDGDNEDMTKAEIKEASPYVRLGSKPHSTPLTLKWLEENYELAEGVCIPRSALYVHYLDFCGHNDTNPVNAASFGKIIRQQFPQITTRRLGTRGQSKYHYYGVAIRETSRYYDVMYSKNGVQAVKTEGRDCAKQVIMYSPRSKLGTLLPEFPDIKDIRLPPNVTEDKVATFLMMYRTHCQRILDTVIRANFDEVQNFLLHFWQGMPQHILPILGCRVIVTLVGVCDSILYKAIAQVLMPSVLQALPESLTQVIRKFAKHIDDWLKIALSSLPENLRKVKFDLARRFAHLLRRQTSLNHLCQATRSVTHSAEIMNQMLDDWTCIDLAAICKQTLYTMDKYSDYDQEVIVKLYHEFESLLHDQAPIEAYIEWLNSMVNRCVVQASSKKPGSIRRTARQFLLMWSCFGTRVIRDMTLHSAPSFGSFHLLHLTFDDYVLYLVESIHTQERYNELLNSLMGYTETCEVLDEIQSTSLTTLTSSSSVTSECSPTADTVQQCRRASVITGTGATDYMKSCQNESENYCSRSYDVTSCGQANQTSTSPASSYGGYQYLTAPSGYDMENYSPVNTGRYYTGTEEKDTWSSARYDTTQIGGFTNQQMMAPPNVYQTNYDYSGYNAYDYSTPDAYNTGCSRFNGYYQNIQTPPQTAPTADTVESTDRYCAKRKTDDMLACNEATQSKRLCSEGASSCEQVIAS